MRQAWRRFPVSLLLLVQFVPFAIVPAILGGNENASFIAGLVAVAVGSALVVELLATPLARRQLPIARPAKAAETITTGARRVAIIALVVAAAATWAGVGSYGVGVGTAQASSAAAFLAPLRPWTFVAVGLFLWAWNDGQITKASTMKWIAVLAASELLVSLSTARMAPAAGAVFAITAACLIVGLIPFRALVAATLIGVLAWPTIAEIRNDQRTQAGAGSTFGGEFDATSRLRMDQLIGRAADYDAPVDLGQPSVVDAIGRYGLIPRPLDPGRPEIATGRLLNVLTGGTSISSYTFMLVGNVYIFEGTIGLALYAAAIAALFQFLLLRRVGPLKVSVLVLAIYYLAWMGITYPDSLIAFVQAVVSSFVAYFLVTRTRFGIAKEKRPEKRSRAKRA